MKESHVTLGLVLDVSNEDYHSGPGLSRSDLVRLLQSPAHFKLGEEKEQTPAMVLGQAFHTYTLQSELFDKKFVILPEDYDGRTAKGKALKAEAGDKQTLKYGEWQDIKGMAEAIRAHPEIARLLMTGLPEVSGYWYDLAYPEILLKCRVDWLNLSENIILDLKSSTEARSEFFTKHAFNFNYHLQAAFYLYVVSTITKTPHRDFYFAVVEKVKPYGVMLYKATEEFIQAGEIEVQKALAIYADCLAKDEWPGYSQEVEPLGLPNWKKKRQQIID